MLTAIIITINILKHLYTMCEEIFLSKAMLEWLSGKE